MVYVVFKGPLISYFKTEKIYLDKYYSSITDLLNEIDKNNILSYNGKLKSGYIILINGKDYRLINKHIEKDDLVEIIPINHGG